MTVARDGPVRIELLQPDPCKARVYVANGVDLVTLELGWDAYEPVPGRIDQSYLAQRIGDARKYADAGLDVVLDLGIQYPPKWVWELPGETRFVDQYGDRWHGDVGTDVLDAVWNMSARQAEHRYVTSIAHNFSGIVDRVRVGGLLSGEIRLPPAHAAGHRDSLWAFGSGALAASPDSTWRPGSGTVAQADKWIDFYMSSVRRYAVWLTQVVNTAFHGLPIDALLPGWGLRPGDLTKAARARVSTSVVVTMGDELAAGVDWARQVPALDRAGADVTAVTTWLDAPSYGTGPRDVAPAQFLAELARPLGMPISGENTGGGGQASLARVRAQATRLLLSRITWLSSADDPVSLALLGRTFPD